MQTTASEKTFHLRWNNHLQNLSQLFTTIYSSAALADVTLSSRDGTIKAHKLVLSACSPYFEQIFKENPCKHPVIILKGIPYSEINLLVEFMYKGSVDVQEMDLQSLMHTASELEIRGLAYEVRKDASQLLNVNLEYPPQSSTPVINTANNYEATPRSAQYHTDMERLRQIHMYQQSMSRSTTYSNAQKKRKDEPMTPAVKNILAAAAKEMAETRSDDPKEDEDNDSETESDDSSQQVGDDDEPSHNLDTRFKGKKRVSVAHEDLDTSKLNKKKLKYGSKSPKSSEEGGGIPCATEITIKTASEVNNAAVNQQQKSMIKVVNISHLQQQRTDESKLMTGNSSHYAGESMFMSDNDEYESDVSYKAAEGGASEIDKMHKCDMCDARFCYVTVLEKHRLKHRMQQCGGCGMTFMDADKFKKHMKTCERDDPTVRDPDEARIRKELMNIPQNAIIPGMVAMGHSERSGLMFTPSGEVILAPRSDMTVNVTPDMSGGMSSANSSALSISMDRSFGEESMMRIDGVDVPIKRGRGRPRKTPVPLVPKIKRKRGRPPKYWSVDGSMHPGPKENYNAANLPYGDFAYLTELMYNQPALAEGFHRSLQNMEVSAVMNMNRNNYNQQRNSIQNSIQNSIPNVNTNTTDPNKAVMVTSQGGPMPINYSTTTNSSSITNSTNNEPLTINKVTEDSHLVKGEPKMYEEHPEVTVNHQPQTTLTVGDCQIITSNENGGRAHENPPINEPDINSITVATIGDCTIERVTENT